MHTLNLTRRHSQQHVQPMVQPLCTMRMEEQQPHAHSPLVNGLTVAELAKYERDGWVIKRNVFAAEECEQLIRYMTSVHDGGAPDFPGAAERNKGSFPGKETAAQRAADTWNGYGQPHLYDETIKAWMLDERLRAPLRDVMGGDEPEGIKSFWWFKVQEGFTNTHCDGTALPKCTAVWIPMVDVDGGVEVGTLALREPTSTHAAAHCCVLPRASPCLPASPPTHTPSLLHTHTHPHPHKHTHAPHTRSHTPPHTTTTANTHHQHLGAPHRSVASVPG